MECKIFPLPTLLIDLKKNRIRIHRCTLQWMENPDCFLFLVNPEERVMAMRSCDASEARAHRNPTKQGAAQSFELYSRSLMRQLRQCGAWEEGKAYKLIGQLRPQDGTIFFQMKDAVEIEKAKDD